MAGEATVAPAAEATAAPPGRPAAPPRKPRDWDPLSGRAKAAPAPAPVAPAPAAAVAAVAAVPAVAAETAPAVAQPAPARVPAPALAAVAAVAETEAAVTQPAPVVAAAAAAAATVLPVLPGDPDTLPPAYAPSWTPLPPTAVLRGHLRAVRCDARLPHFSLSPTFALGAHRESIQLYQPRHPSPPLGSAVCWTPDQCRLASGGVDGAVLLWDAWCPRSGDT